MLVGWPTDGRADADGPERKEKPSDQPADGGVGRIRSEREAQRAGDGGEQKGQVVKVFSQTRFGASEEEEDGIKHEIGCQDSP